MKVHVTKPAFHNASLVQPGDVIEVGDGFKASWAVPLDAAPVPAKKEKAKPETKALSELGKGQAQTFNQVMGKKDSDDIA